MQTACFFAESLMRISLTKNIRRVMDYNLVIRHCLSHTDESYDETFLRD